MLGEVVTITNKPNRLGVIVGYSEEAVWVTKWRMTPRTIVMWLDTKKETKHYGHGSRRTNLVYSGWNLAGCEKEDFNFVKRKKIKKLLDII